MTILDPRRRFTGTAQAYDAHRPGYPDALIDWLHTLAPAGRAADIGCGTGITTRLFASRRQTVGIDPNEEMLDVARRRGGDYQKGEAAATGLPDRSIALIAAGQAFHWFDVDLTLREWRRISIPGALACAFWNVRSSTPFLDVYEELLQRHSSEYKEVRREEETIAELRNRLPDLIEKEFPNEQRLDWEGLLGRVSSASYVAHGVKDRPALDRDLRALYDRHQQEGQVVFVYRTLVAAWRPESKQTGNRSGEGAGVFP